MTIPLVGSPPLPINYDDRLVGDSSDFRFGIGNWTNSGGTLTADTTVAYLWPSNNTYSAKLVTTADAQYLECAVPGAFVMGAEYTTLIAVTIEENPSVGFKLDFGEIGTDAAQITVPASVAGGQFRLFAVHWIPSGLRSGVKVRMTRDGGSGTKTLHVSHCRVVRSLPKTGLFIPHTPATSVAKPSSGVSLYVENTVNNARISAGGKTNGGVILAPSGSVTLEAEGTYAGLGVSSGAAWLQAESATGDLAAAGFNLEVGTDYVGLYVSERDSNTVQLYADVSGGYMMQLRNRGSGKGWAVSDDGTVNGRIDDTFQWAFYVAGTLTTGTDKAAYWQVPAKCRIDEVRIHVGTAPTSTSVIVDVNDDGTTIFTTQGNRPEIAASATDDTSGAADGGTAIAKDSVLTIDIDQIGSGTAGADLAVFVRGRFIW